MKASSMAWTVKEAALEERASLWEALGFKLIPHMKLCFVGGGGKTTAMFALADELAAMGKRVIVTTSTHIYQPKDRRLVIGDRAALAERYIIEHLELCGSGWVLTAGVRALEGKLSSLPLSELSKLAALCDVLLIEGDGAKRLPLKLPAEHEPVIPPDTFGVIGCMGLDCIGRTWEKGCFRWELGAGVFKKMLKKDDLITAEAAAEILKSFQGTRKGAEGLEYRLLLNKADDSQALLKAREVCCLLGAEWAGRTAITSFLSS